MKHEQQFEKDLAQVAQLLGCFYAKIPDTKMLNAENRYRNREQKRPFDAVIITPNGNFCIEAKYMYGELKDHQKHTQSKINNINGSYYVLRKKMLKIGVVYTVEQPEKKMVFTTQKIEEIINFFMEI